MFLLFWICSEAVAVAVAPRQELAATRKNIVEGLEKARSLICGMALSKSTDTHPKMLSSGEKMMVNHEIPVFFSAHIVRQIPPAPFLSIFWGSQCCQQLEPGSEWPQGAAERCRGDQDLKKCIVLTINLSMIRILSMITMTKWNTDFSENRHDSHYHISLGCPTSHFDIHSTPHVHGTGKGVWFGTGAEEDGGAGRRSRENPWNSWSMMNIP